MAVRRDYLRGKLGRGRFWDRVGKRMSGQLYVDRGGDPSRSILLAGSARAGTTWVSDIVNHDGEYRYIFEPFHPNRLDMTQHFRPRQYLRPSDRDPAYLRPAQRIMSGKVRSVWTDKYNRQRFASRRLIKEVRGNLLLGWIDANFPGTPIVLVLRHPCAVASSQLDLKWNWHLDLSDFLSQTPLMEDHLEPFRHHLSSDLSPFEQHVTLWCVENYVPLRQFRAGQIHVLFYEDLCTDPGPEIQRLFAYLGKPYDPRVLDGIGRPSAVTRRTSAIVSGGDLVDGWTQRVDGRDAQRAVEILRLFGLDRVYEIDPMPRPGDPMEVLAGA